MQTYANRDQENQNNSVAAKSNNGRKQNSVTTAFIDNRPEAIQMRKMQEMADNSSEVTQMKGVQHRANNTLQNQELAQLQKMANANVARQYSTNSKNGNSTGLPDHLKTGMENLSGMSLDDVKVHHGSDKPAQLNAHAYAQGTDIHLAPGQEKHLPHELGHVVQQKEGRVSPTSQINGKTPINDDLGLEREASALGEKALQVNPYNPTDELGSKTSQSKPVAQLFGRGVKTNNVGLDTGNVKGEVAGGIDGTAAYLGTGLNGPSYGNALASGEQLPDANTENLLSGGGASPAISGIGGSLGMLVNIGTGGQAIYGLVNSKREETSKSYNTQNTALTAGNKQLYAAVKILENEKQKALTSDLENVEQLGGSINGVINGITTLLNSIGSVANSATAGISAVTFGIGAGLNALVGTISGLRFSLKAHQRRMNQVSIRQLYKFCIDLSDKYESEIKQLEDENKRSEMQMRVSLAYLKELRDKNVKEENPSYKLHKGIILNYDNFSGQLKSEIIMLGTKITSMMDLIQGLEVSGRKSGYKYKSTSATLNFVGAGGGAALLAATIGGVAAAATPIGWTLTGAAAVGLLIWEVGKYTKRKIRNSNVVRMRQERQLIQNGLRDGSKHKSDIWFRRDYQTEEKKGWFNQLTSHLFHKKKSGTITIEQRLKELDQYLKKYDVEEAGNKAYAGILAALTSEQGADKVDVGNGLEKTFKQATTEMLTTLGVDPILIINSMTGDYEAQENAKKLVLEKMRLLPKTSQKEVPAEEQTASAGE